MTPAPAAPVLPPQQMRGSCSPTSMSTIRSLPTIVRMVTMPGMIGDDRADAGRSGALRAGPASRPGPRRRRRPARRPRACPRWRRGTGRGRASRRRRGPGPGSGSPPPRGPCRRRRSSAISLSADERPPRVGSRRTWTPGSTASIAATSPLSACVSEAISTSNSRPSRTLMIATPWRPIGPDRMTASPGRARSADGATPSGTSPIPAVLTKSRSAAPRPTTFVSPVTIATPARAAARAAEAVMSASSSSGRPSSMM